MSVLGSGRKPGLPEETWENVGTPHGKTPDGEQVGTWELLKLKHRARHYGDVHTVQRSKRGENVVSRAFQRLRKKKKTMVQKVEEKTPGRLVKIFYNL